MHLIVFCIFCAGNYSGFRRDMFVFIDVCIYFLGFLIPLHGVTHAGQELV